MSKVLQRHSSTKGEELDLKGPRPLLTDSYSSTHVMVYYEGPDSAKCGYFGTTLNRRIMEHTQDEFSQATVSSRPLHTLMEINSQERRGSEHGARGKVCPGSVLLADNSDEYRKSKSRQLAG